MRHVRSVLVIFGLAWGIARAQTRIEDFWRWQVPAENSGEAFVRYIHRILSRLIDATLEATPSTLTDREKQILLAISDDYARERHLGKLEFKDPDQNPGLFEAAGPHRLAVTGTNANDPIIFNSKLIASASFDEILGLLVHEYGHHQGIKDEDDRFLDQIAAKVRADAKVTEQSLAAQGFPKGKLIQFNVANYPRPPSTQPKGPEDFHPVEPTDTWLGTHLLVSDGQSVFDLRRMLASRWGNFAVQVINLGIKVKDIESTKEGLDLTLGYKSIRSGGRDDTDGNLQFHLAYDPRSTKEPMFSRDTKLFQSKVLPPDELDDAYALLGQSSPAGRRVPMQEISVHTNQDALAPGDTWEITADFKSPFPVDNVNVVIFRPSSEPGVSPLTELLAPMKGDERRGWTDLGNSTYRLHYRYQIPRGAAPGPIYLYEVRAFHNGEDIMGSLRPSVETAVKVTGDPLDYDLQVEGAVQGKAPLAHEPSPYAGRDLLKEPGTPALVTLEPNKTYFNLPIEVTLKGEKAAQHFSGAQVVPFGKGVSLRNPRQTSLLSSGGGHSVSPSPDDPTRLNVSLNELLYLSPFNEFGDDGVALHGFSLRSQFNEKVVRFPKPIPVRSDAKKVKVLGLEKLSPACAQLIEDLIGKSPYPRP